MCRAHIALQELQTVAMVLHRLAFCLSGKVVVLHFDNSTAKAYLCNQDSTVSPFLSRLACQRLSLTAKHSITLIPAYILSHISRRLIISHGFICFWSQPSLDISGKLCVPCSCTSSSSSIKVSGRTCERSTQTFDSGGTMLDGGSLGSHSSQHVGRHSLVLSHHKMSLWMVLAGRLLNGLPYLHLTLWLLRDMCFTDKGSLPESVRQCWGKHKHLQ